MSLAGPVVHRWLKREDFEFKAWLDNLTKLCLIGKKKKSEVKRGWSNHLYQIEWNVPLPVVLAHLSHTVALLGCQLFPARRPWREKAGCLGEHSFFGILPRASLPH